MLFVSVRGESEVRDGSMEFDKILNRKKYSYLFHRKLRQILESDTEKKTAAVQKDTNAALVHAGTTP